MTKLFLSIFVQLIEYFDTFTLNMRKHLLKNILVSATIALLLLGGADSFALPSDGRVSHVFENQDPPAKSSTVRSFFSNWFFQPFRQNSPRDNQKILSNVKVFPNPTVETINLSFRLEKRAEVTIKVMDALGNELLVLLQENLEAGVQNHSFEIQNRLATGVYFIRLTSDAETVIKRISVL